MSNYTKSTNFATKDNLTPGDPLKVVRGTEIDTEYNNIATAIATKTDNASAAITGGSITGITDLAVADGGTGASTAATALNNLLPSQTSNANKYLQTDGTNATWDAVSLSTADITGTLGVANGGTGVTTSTGTTNVVLSNSPTLVTPALGTPSALVGTNITGTASGLTAGNVTTNANLTGAVTSVGNATSLGSFTSANLLAALTDETGTGSAVFATSPTLVTPALGTPSALVGTNITGTASGLTAGNVTTNANLTGDVTSVGNATTLTNAPVIAKVLTGYVSGAGTVAATDSILQAIQKLNGNDATNANLTGMVTSVGNATTVVTNANLTGAVTSVGNATSLGSFTSAQLATALTDETGSGANVFATSPTLVTPTLGVATATSLQGIIGNVTPAAGAFTTVTASTAIGTTSGGTGLSSFTSGGVVYASSSSALATGSALTFDGSTVGAFGGSTVSYRFNANRGTDDTTQGVRFGYAGLDVYRTGTPLASSQTSLLFTQTGSDGTRTPYYIDANGNSVWSPGAGASPSESMRLTSTGLGIGTSSPAALLHLSKAFGSSTYAEAARFANTSLNSGAKLTFFGVQGSDASAKLSGAIGFNQTNNSDSNGQPAFIIETGNNGSISERARIESSGNLLLGTTSANFQVGERVSITPASGKNAMGIALTNTDSLGIAIYSPYTATAAVGAMKFQAHTAAIVGSITFTSTATTYNTTSDYRLKTVHGAITGYGERIDALKPISYEWKNGALQDRGFLAHEFQIVYPNSVNGTKDAVDANGNPVYQAMQASTSEVIADLVAEIQSLRQRLSAANL